MKIELTKNEIILLYCKWCPYDCKGLTDEEKLGCVAPDGFTDELLGEGQNEKGKETNMFQVRG